MEFTDEPLRPFGTVLLDTGIPSELSLKTALVFRVMKVLAENECIPAAAGTTAELVLDEAITNAMVHGNRMDPTLSVRIRVFADEDKWGAIIEDEGEGFERTQVPQVLGIESLLRETGRGIMLMDTYLDELTYSANGTKVMLARRREAEGAAEEAPAAAPAAAEGAEPVQVRRQDGIAVAEVTADRVFGDNAQAVRAALEAAAEGADALVLDLSRVTYLSSVGLAVVVATYKLVSAGGGPMLLAGASQGVRELLDKSGLSGFFRFADNADEGVKLAADLA
jgi:serine/threonine-protein kinase RsbW